MNVPTPHQIIVRQARLDAAEERQRRAGITLAWRLRDLDTISGALPGDRRASMRRLRRVLPEDIHAFLSPEGAAEIAVEMRERAAKAESGEVTP